MAGSPRPAGSPPVRWSRSCSILRELLIRNLAPVLVAMRARQGMAIMLRLNRVIDKGIAVAVVGYTDALVATLFAQNGVPAFGLNHDFGEVERQIDCLEQELQAVARPVQVAETHAGAHDGPAARRSLASSLPQPPPPCPPHPQPDRHRPQSGPLVSVIVPARNESAIIATVVGSILATTYHPFELLVVDDRSTDDTAAIVEGLNDPRFAWCEGKDSPRAGTESHGPVCRAIEPRGATLLLFTDADTRHAPGAAGASGRGAAAGRGRAGDGVAATALRHLLGAGGHAPDLVAAALSVPPRRGQSGAGGRGMSSPTASSS